MPQNYGLGKGLASLIPKKNIIDDDSAPQENDVPEESIEAPVIAEEQPKEESNNSVLEVEVGKIVPNPHQPRIEFNEEKLTELSNSIRSHGIIQPLVVSQKDDHFEIIAGERRFQAAKEAGLESVPVIVRATKEKEKLELAIVENVQRHDLNPVEEAKAYQKLIDDFQMNQEEVADKVGKSRSAVANKIRLLNLPVEIQRAIIEEKITEGHAKAILALSNPEKQRALFELILKNKLTVRQAEGQTKEISVRSHRRVSNADPEVQELENKLVGIFGTKVKVSKSGDAGKITIDYYSKEDLDSILGKINDSPETE